MSITVADFTSYLNKAVELQIKAVIDSKVKEIEQEVRNQTDKIAMNIMQEYDIRMSDMHVVITVRKML